MADIQKRHIYHVYRGATFLGVLQNVSSDFEYPQDINTNAVQITVEVDATADVADMPVEPILDQTGNIITDENNEPLYEERAQDVVGSFNPLALIQEDNILKVYEISSDTPNGQIVFDGYIEDWRAKMGSSSDYISFTAISKGVDMSDYLVEGAQSIDQSDTAGGGGGSLGAGSTTRFGQSFTTGVGVTNITAINLRISKNFGATHDQDVTLKLYNSPAEANANLDPMAESTVTLTGSPNPSGIETLFIFPESVDVADATTYFFTIECTDSEGYMIIQSIDAYANGAMYVYDGSSTGFDYVIVPYSFYTGDLWFETYYTSGATNSTFTDEDPSQIIKDVLDNYALLGGIVTYTEDSIDMTGLSVTYTFKVNTILEAVKKCLELAPANYYFYVDPATNVLYFKQTPDTPTHKFIKGRHFGEIEIGATVENVRNILYFTGGDDGSGVNLFRKYTNSASLAVRRRRLDRLSDNRVTLDATADTIAENFLEEHADTDYNSPVTILAGTYDIKSIKVGDTAKLEGYGNFADTLTLQIARVKQSPDKADVTLGVLLKRESDAVIEALDALDKLQTVDNPDTPS